MARIKKRIKKAYVWKVYYDHIFDGYTGKTFLTKAKAQKHIRSMNRRYPYGKFELKKVKV